ncbi:UbiD family decarboxylase, partial [bacterium]|nr:UbiD family decarboxylase [bacterium]
VPYEESRRPRELLTQANAILGQGQLSLAKYLFIVAKEDDPGLSIDNIPGFFRHVLERADWTRDLHFQTATTIDTLDYSGTGLNEGSKLVIAVAGPKRRDLPVTVPSEVSLPPGFSHPSVCLPGILAVSAPRYQGTPSDIEPAVAAFCDFYRPEDSIGTFPIILLVDDSNFAAASLNNFLWVTFTRSNPAADIQGIGASIRQKHFGSRGPIVIDARIKPHHAPPLESDPEIEKRVDALGAQGRPLHGII